MPLGSLPAQRPVLGWLGSMPARRCPAAYRLKR